MKKMRSIYIFCFLFCILTTPINAQRRANKGFTCASLQDQPTILAIGVKAGDPSSLTIKGYFLRRFGIEATAGYAVNGNFPTYVVGTLEKEPSFNGFTYQNHKVKGTYAGQARVMMHLPLIANLPGLDWFILAGYYYRSLDVDYKYTRLTVPGDPTSSVTGNTTYKILDKGPELGAGLEYAISKKPFAFFAEVSALRMDNGINNTITALGGVGVRFNIAMNQKAGNLTGSQRSIAPKGRRSSYASTLSDISSNTKGKRGLMTKAKKKTKRKTTVHKHKNQPVIGFDPDNF